MTALEAGAALAVGLGNSLLHAEPAAAGAGLGHWTVPGREVARRVTQAPPEGLAPFGTPFGEIAIGALGALESHRDRAGAFTLGVRGAGQELAEPPGLDDHVGAAEVTLLVAGTIGHLVPLQRLHIVAGVLVLDAGEVRAK